MNNDQLTIYLQATELGQLKVAIGQLQQQLLDANKRIAELSPPPAETPTAS